MLLSAFALTLVVAGLLAWIGFSTYRSVTVRKPNAYAMQSVGHLIVEHMRLHSGAWPRGWAELQDTCAKTGSRILATSAEAEIEELKGRVEVDWDVDPEGMRRSARRSDIAPISVVRLRSGRRDSFAGAEPNLLIWEYLKQTTEPVGPANRSQPVSLGTNSTPLPAGSGR